MNTGTIFVMDRIFFLIVGICIRVHANKNAFLARPCSSVRLLVSSLVLSLQPPNQFEPHVGRWFLVNLGCHSFSFFFLKNTLSVSDYKNHWFYRLQVQGFLSTLCPPFFCQPSYFLWVIMLSFWFLRQHYRRKTSQTVFYSCFTGCKNKIAFAARFCKFAYMKIKKHVRCLQPSNQYGPNLEGWCFRTTWTWQFYQNAHSMHDHTQYWFYRSSSVWFDSCLRLLHFLSTMSLFFAGSSTKTHDKQQSPGARRCKRIRH